MSQPLCCLFSMNYQFLIRFFIDATVLLIVADVSKMVRMRTRIRDAKYCGWG